MLTNKISLLSFFTLISMCLSGCSKYKSPEINQGLNDTKPILYNSLYDPISDQGQYNLPEMTKKPKKYWSLVEVITVGNRNNIGETEEIRGLQYHLLSQSIAGLTNKAVEEGRSEIGVWMQDHGGSESYTLSKQALKNMGISEQGGQSGIELARNTYGSSDGVHIQIKDLFSGYILTDVTNNPESNMVASVASSIYNSIIVDVRDKAKYDAAGYKMTYDARSKSTADAWREFKDKVSKKALVVMPVQTGELRDFAIKNNLFVLNINKKFNQPSGGQNLDLLDEILKSLDPGAPVYGWEQGVDESLFVDRASILGHVWVPSDWIYNLSMTSLLYKSRQEAKLAQIVNPQFIDWSKKKKFVSYYLSDGDNIQWMMNDFVRDYYNSPYANDMKMGFGVPVSNLNMMAPAQFSNIFSQQKPNYTLIEALGGGYMYVDNYGSGANRSEQLAQLSKRVASSMRQHRVKVLGLMAKDVKSANALAGYKAFVDANDQLEGIVVMQYSPYAGGNGETYWVTNKQGYDIPVITVKYSLWNFGSQNHQFEGTPAYVASKLKTDDKSPFSVIAVHAWSTFKDLGSTSDLTAENASGGNMKGAGAAKLLTNHLSNDFEVVNVQELIWRVRNQYKPDQTSKYLKAYY
ncbi:GxGYxYP domain-containing protein [Pedobacter nutrimenti]|uniref:GxGYxYP domain-containing protein n=1 Tax=Pedobacter nutrimenti TaxID=1241337 RepID=UPI00292E364A|nr:GxGYxYP domain-containing protein [Pedobacter nutrimenti]